MSSFPTLEHRSLERRGSSPPDVYNQHEGQKEDIMSEDSVRDGYKYIKPVRDEYESCKKESKFLNIESIWKFYHGVLSKKLNTSSSLELRKKQLPNFRDSAVPLIDINKIQVSDWFRELSGAASLASLGRRIPFAKDKKEILNELIANKVPISRAVWLINMSVIQTTAHAETTKRKPRAPFDPTGDWTSTICSMLKHILDQMSQEPSADLEIVWDYLFILMIDLCDTDMADHWEIATWLVKRVESLWKPGHELTVSLSQLNFFLQYLVNFGFRVTENELLTRRLLYWCCTVFSHLFIVEKNSPNVGKNPSDVRSILAQYAKTESCPLHRSIIIKMSSLISGLFLTLPSAAIWHSIPFETDHSYLKGSPLDHIPYSLSLLPVLPGPEASSIRQCLFDVEEVVIARSKMVEHGWKQPTVADLNGEDMNRLVKVLNILDQQDYNIVQELNPMETLFNQIFQNDSINVNTSEVVLTLCEWATSSHRVGIHRAIIVASLLEQLHSKLQSDPDSTQQMLQATLVQFLDTSAPLWPPFVTDRAPIDNEQMRCLVCLYSELIDREVFSHDAYVRQMIARGVFNTSFHPLATIEHQPVIQSSLYPNNLIGQGGRGQSVPPNITVTTTSSYPNSALGAQYSVASELSEDNDRCSMDNPDSVRSDVGLPPSSTHGSILQPALDVSLTELNTTRSPHFHYLAQFPLPQDDSYMHEANQRYQLLYGSLRSRDRARCRVRQLVRNINKLLTRKIYLVDVIHGEMCRRKRTKERDRSREQEHPTAPNTAPPSQAAGACNFRPSSGEDTHSIDKLHEDIMARFVNLSYHDMECVISQCIPTLIKVLSGSHGVSNPVSSGESLSVVAGALPNIPSARTVQQTDPFSSQSHLYMPVPNTIFLIFELIEISLNITCLLTTIVDTLERLQTLYEPRSSFMSLYMSFLCLRSVGIFQRYQPIFFTMSELQIRLFPTLISQVRQVKEPTQCRPYERCILAYVNDLFSSSTIINTKFKKYYVKAHQKVSASFRSIEPCEGSATFDPNYASDLLQLNTADNVILFRTYAENLRADPNSRFSFVCVALVTICQATTAECVNYCCGLCSELTSQCAELSPEWLGSLYALLAPRPYTHGYAPIVTVLDPSDMNMYDNVSSLIGTLLSRHCFTISDFLRRVICPAMAQGLDQPVGPELEPSIRLACHILHRLFTVESTVSSLQYTANVLTPGSEFSLPTCTPVQADSVAVSMPPFRISEPLLLTSALQKVTPELLVDVLKMLIVHNDKASIENQSDLGANDDLDVGGNATTSLSANQDGDGNESSTGDDSSDDANRSDDVGRHKRKKHASLSASRKQSKRRCIANSSQPFHAVVVRFIESGVPPTMSELRTLSLSALIQLVLREICTSSWVRERFYRMLPKRLIRENVLIDKKFSPNQARRLLHIIFHPFDMTWTDVPNLASAMCQVLSSLDLWTLNCAQMKFQLLYAQIQFPQQSDVLGVFAQSIVAGFQAQALEWLKRTSESGLSSDGLSCPIGGLSHFELQQNNPVWLVSVLITNLHKLVKIQIVKATLETLRGVKHFWKHKNDEEKENVLLQHSVLLAHPAFFALLQLCLEEVDPMDALHEQIEYFVENARETEDRVPDNLRTRQVVQECLRLRLQLVGQRFSGLPLDLEASSRWALLLTQLISHGVAEPESNSSLFYMIYDMLQGLVHALVAKSDLEGKSYQNFVKKARRELAERPPSYGIEQIKPLLPPLRTPYTVVATGRTDQKNNSLSSSTNSSTATGGNTGTKGPGKATGNKGSGKTSGAGGSGRSHDSKVDKSNAKRGLVVLGKERFAPWDVLDPAKQLLLLSLHGVTQIGAVPSRSEEQANRLIRHDHFVRMQRSSDFYLNSIYSDLVECESAQSSSVHSIQSGHGSTPTKITPSGSNTGATPNTSTSVISTKLKTESCDGSKRTTSKTSADSLKRPHPSSGHEELRGLSSAIDNNCIPYKFEADASRIPPFTNRRPKPQQTDYSHRTEPHPGTSFVSSMQRYGADPQYTYNLNPTEHIPQDSFYPHATASKRLRPNVDVPIRTAMPESDQLSSEMSTNKPNPQLLYPTNDSVLPPAQMPTSKTTKKKRGPNRRSSATTMDRVATSTHMTPRGAVGLRPSGMKMEQQIVDNYPHSELDAIISDPSGGGWLNKPTMAMGAEPTPPHRSSTQMSTIRGLIRNRAQQQQQLQQRSAAAASASMQPRQPIYPTAFNTVRPPDSVQTGSSYDPSEMSHYASVYPSNNESQLIGSYVRPDIQLGDQSIRPMMTTASLSQRYLPQTHYNQQRVIVGEHGGAQQGVPNPPPYPMAQQSQAYPSVQSSFMHGADESYVISTANHKPIDDGYVRIADTHHSAVHRHPSYTIGHAQQQQQQQQAMQTDQLVHHPSMGSHPSQSGPRMVNPGHLIHSNLHSQTAPQSQHYSRFPPY